MTDIKNIFYSLIPLFQDNLIKRLDLSSKYFVVFLLIIFKIERYLNIEEIICLSQLIEINTSLQELYLQGFYNILLL